MLANPTLETMTGAVLLGDADLSLGIQDQLKCGNKVRVLLAGPGPLSLMVSLLIDQTFRAERDFQHPSVRFQMSRVPATGRRGEHCSCSPLKGDPINSAGFKCGRKMFQSPSCLGVTPSGLSCL